MEYWKTRTIMSKITDQIKVENTLNRPGDILPYGYFNPQTEGKLIWICNYGINGDEIVSVFTMVEETGSQKDIKYLADLDQAKYVRDELIKHGWKPYIPPKIDIKF